MKRLLSLAPVLVAIVFPFITVQACGPYFFDDVFVRPMRPDHPPEFAAGKLGILLSTYSRAELAVAYRYLNGGTLTPEEQKAYAPAESYRDTVVREQSEDAQDASSTSYAEPLGPADEWLAVRNRYATPQPQIRAVGEYGQVYPQGVFLAGSYSNCQGDAFRTAIAALGARAKSWGAKSVELADWIKGQDAVFSNCGGGQYMSWIQNRPTIQPSAPATTFASAPLLLRQDRAYQIAAAQFYAGQFTAARTSFQAIAQDQSSPWHGIAAYLVARTLVRDAFLSAPPNSGQTFAAFNADKMKQAQRQLESIRELNLPGISQHGIQELLNLVRLRTEPEARIRELAAAVAGPTTDPYYVQDLGDLDWYLSEKLDEIPIREDIGDEALHIDHPQGVDKPLTDEQKLPGFNKAFHDAADLRSLSPLVDWLITFQSPAPEAKKHALQEWKRSHSMPWLLAALQKASASDSEAPALIEAAGRVPSTSPAWLTATFHRERLLLGTSHINIAGVETTGIKAAGIETDALMDFVEKSGSESAVNLFHGLRMRAATSLDDALADAPRRILERTSQQQFAVKECLAVMKDPKRHYDCKDPKSPVEFSEDSAGLFNSEMPLTTLAQAAQSNSLPQSLRQSVAMMTWVRAVLLQNEIVARQMLPLLPDKLRQQAGVGVGFHPLVAILRNPGLRPFLNAGVQRSYSYDFVESYSDNWWCTDWTTIYTEKSPLAPPGPVAFLTPEMRSIGERETKQLRALGGADGYLGAQVLAYANAHPNDSDVPEALYLTLRMLRYGCYQRQMEDMQDASASIPTGIARQVVALMRRRYIASTWTRKAAPFVYLGDPKAN